MITIKKKNLILLIVGVFVAGLLVTTAAALAITKGALGSVSVPKDDYAKMSECYENYGKLDLVRNHVEENYYKDVDSEDLIEGECKGLLMGLDDPYSSYMTKDEYDSWKASATGEYSGVGISFSQDLSGNYIVVSIVPDSPASKTDIEPGDFLLEINGKSYTDMDLMAKDIRGKAGTDVEVTYYDGKEDHTVTMTREDIVQHSVEHEMLDDETGYIKLSQFIENSGEDFTKALDDIEKKGGKKLVLDLRDNGGGLVESCLDIADEFLDEGVVTYVEDREGSREEYKSEDGKRDIETVVLVNENSASCSEILAAALKDNGFDIVGENTFGKGVIQSTTELTDGSAVKLTIMQYFSPDGNVIHEKGVKPDVTVKDDEDTEADEQLDRALKLF